MTANAGPVRHAEEAVELYVNTKPTSKCRGEYAKFTPEEQANIGSDMPFLEGTIHNKLFS